MQKTHQSPEFTVIKQDQANAKFFVASFENAGGDPQQTSTTAASYSTDDGSGSGNQFNL